MEPSLSEPCSQVSEYKLKNNRLLKEMGILHLLHIVFGLRYKRQRQERLKYIQTIRLGSKLYFYLMVLFMWAKVLRFLSVYDLNDRWGRKLVEKFMYHIVLLNHASGSILAIKLCKNTDSFFHAWWKYKLCYGTDTDAFFTRLGKRTKIVTVISSFVIILIEGLILNDFLLNQLQGTFAKMHLKGVISDESNDRHNPIAILLLAVYVISLAYYILPTTYIAVICLSLRDEFQMLRRDLSSEGCEQIAQNQCLESYRRRHMKTCDLVAQWDDICSVFVLAVFVLNVPLMCFLLYYLLILPDHLDVNDIVLLWIPCMLFSLSPMLIITAVGSLLHISSLQIKNDLYRLDLSNSGWTDSQKFQYTTFLSKLIEGHIGITAWRLFYINKMTTKMIFLMIVSYTVIMLKFGNQETKVASPANNGTDAL